MAQRTIDRYEIKSELGRGGMATVYLAYDPRFRREVAVKVLPPGLLHDPLFRRRFDREAQTVAAVEHPAIVPVYDYGEDGGQLFLVMRYMSGGSLADRIRAGPIPLKEAVAILGHLAPGLDEAHRRGVVHRDLKPDNVLFDSSGHPMLSDFGIAKIVEETTVLTVGGMIGTPAYISPEQAAGSKDIDGRSDLYSLGVMLFQMLSGKLPYEAPTPVSLALMHIREPVPSFHDHDPSLARVCDPVIARAMAKKPRDRYQTAGELVRALEACSNRKTPLLPLPTPGRRPARAGVQKAQSELAGTMDAPVPGALPAPHQTRLQLPRRMAVIGAVVMGAAAGAIILGRELQGGYSSAQPARSPAPWVTATESSIATLLSTPGATSTVAPPEATAGTTPTPRPVVIGKENASGIAILETIGSGGVQDLAWSSDGALLAIGGNILTIWDVAEAKTVYFFDTEGTPLLSWAELELHWEPDSRQLAGWSIWGVPVWVYEAGSPGDPRVLDSAKTGWVSSIEWAPAGRTLGMGTDAGNIVLWDSQTDTFEYYSADHVQLVSGIAWSPDSRLVASSSWDGTSKIYDTTSGARVAVLGGMGGSLGGIAWSPNGAVLALRSWYTAHVTLWDTRSWARVATAEGTEEKPYPHMAWSPDGNYLALPGEEEVVILEQGGDQHEVVIPQADFAAWSPNSEMLAVASRSNITFLAAPDWEPAFVLEGHAAPVDWSPDGVLLAARRSEGGASVLGIP